MEGTVFKKAVSQTYGSNTAPSLWQAIGENLGEKARAEERNTQLKHDRGEYKSYIHWMADTLEIYKSHKLSFKFFHDAVNSIEYHTGVKEVFRELNAKGIKTALVTGGFMYQARRAAIDLHIDHVFAACELFWGEDGFLSHFNLLPFDYLGKPEVVRLLITAYQLGKDECAFVGDGKNDIPVAQSVGLSIAFNAHTELQRASTFSVNQGVDSEDMSAVLEYLL